MHKGMAAVLLGACVGASPLVNISDDDYCTYLRDLAATKGYVDPTEVKGFEDAAAFVADGFAAVPADLFPTWNISNAERDYTLAYLTNFTADRCRDVKGTGTPFPFHPYTDCMDGPVIAPKSHTLVYQNEKVQVIHWHLSPGYQEPYHTHVLASLTYVLMPAGRTYYNATGGAVSTTTPYHGDGKPLELFPQEPEWLHSIGNKDTHTEQVIRVFFRPRGRLSYVPHLD
eukprot:Hpha_TRINITY_DN16972_c1_g3::TRINITY_DN16972_c1_g3_i1::g.55822::m.55822